MRNHVLLLCWSPLLCWAAVVTLSPRSTLAEETVAIEPVSKRVLWATSRIVGSPDPPAPYRTQVAFPKLKFDEPLAMTFVPGSNRLVVVEHFGKVYTFEQRRDVMGKELFLDLAKVLEVQRISTLGIAFHPKFVDNGFVFISYRRSGEKRGTKVARFRVSPSQPWQVDPASHEVLIDWHSAGHDGGCLKFGPDGYLYIGIGDGGGLHDPVQRGQDLSYLNSSILRIDIDRRQDDLGYRIPQENPFRDTPGARPEIWAYGFRQPWKLSFDRETGELWAADVGEDLWESVYRVQRAGNYGWSVNEGGRPFRPQRRRGPTPMLKPVVAHDHSMFRSITGGFVYRGRQQEMLQGQYIYGDYDTGKIWALGLDEDRIVEHRELCDSTLRIAGFAEDRVGELYLVDHVGGQIHSLVPNEVADTSNTFPRKLSETGLFASTKDHVPAPGVLPYQVLAPQWTDGSTKQRFVALPGNAVIEFEAVRFPYRGGRDGWKFPDGAVLVETHTLAMDTADPRSGRRLETRILHQERIPGSEANGDQYWRGYTYVWNDQQTDALLLESPGGLDRTFTIKDESAANGMRQQTWHFPGRTECMVCHTMAAKYVLGLQTLQVNRALGKGDDRNQLSHFQSLGLFAADLPQPPPALPRLVDYHDPNEPLHDRARSYLHANCAHCHRNGGGGNADFFVMASIDLRATQMVNAPAKHGSFYIPQARIVSQHDPYRSLIYYRMATLGSGRMPRLGSRVVDQQGLDLIYQWIAEGAGVEAKPATTDSLFADQVAALQKEALSEEQLADQISQLLTSTLGATRLAHAIDRKQLAARSREAAISQATQHERPHIRDLFERYLPEQLRVKRLGTLVNAAAILKLSGDARNGEQLFFAQAGLQCRNCHRVAGKGQGVGPDLDKVGMRLTRGKILESILEPSKTIDTRYLQYLCETTEGQILSGVIIKKNERSISLRDAKGKVHIVLHDQIETLAAQAKSMMPELLTRDLTAQQLADLLDYLSQLK